MRHLALAHASSRRYAPLRAVTRVHVRYSPERPRRLNLVLHHDADHDVSRWLIGDRPGGVPFPLREVVDFAGPGPSFDWSGDDDELLPRSIVDRVRRDAARAGACSVSSMFGWSTTNSKRAPAAKSDGARAVPFAPSA